MTTGDAAIVSVFVRVPPRDAFEVFTTETDSWWRTGPKYRISGKRPGRIYFEPGAGGRLFETFDAARGSRTFEVGKVTVWEPPSRLALEWRSSNYAPGEKTFVEVTFEPMRDGTMVTVRHSGWSALRPDHPARHGLEGSAFTRMIGLFWGDLMTALREHVTR
jgi:uncharacterized protein YndB with AHSA1/START domain